MNAQERLDADRLSWQLMNLQMQKEALDRLSPYDVVYRHDDGDLTIKSQGLLYVVTREGDVFRQVTPCEEKIRGIVARIVGLECKKGE